jgi:uracil-DNA glycosylase family 4
MDRFEHLRSELMECRLCRNSFGFEPRPVVQGKADSKIFQIGQAPSKTVHETGRPFDDQSGKRLKGQWYGISDSLFYDPVNFYTASMAHCYPGKAKGGGDIKPPRICAGLWLKRELELVDNEIYIIVGGYAASFFFPKEKMSDLVFSDKRICGKPAFILPHPSPINVKWFKDNPQFEEERIPVVREAVHRVLGIK